MQYFVINPGAIRELTLWAGALDQAGQLVRLVAPFANGELPWGLRRLGSVPPFRSELGKRAVEGGPRPGMAAPTANTLECRAVVAARRGKRVSAHAFYKERNRKLQLSVLKAHRPGDLVLTVPSAAGELMDANVPFVLYAPALHPDVESRYFREAGVPPAVASLEPGFDELLDRAVHVLTPSHLALESFIERGVPRRRLSVCPPAVPFPDVPPPRPARADTLRVLFVGRVGRRKGVDLLIKAAEPLGRDVEITLAGSLDGDVSIPNNVRHVGLVSRGAINQLHQQHDLLVHPSLSDSFGLSVTEALASGMPAVVSSHTGIAPVVTAHSAGLVVPAGDDAALHDALRTCVSDTDILASWGRSARNAAQFFSDQLAGRHLASALADVVYP